MWSTELSDTWRALATVRVAVADAVHAALHSRTAAIAPELPPWALVAIWSAMAVLAHAAHAATRHVLQGATARAAPAMAAQQAAETRRALASLGLALPEQVHAAE